MSALPEAEMIEINKAHGKRIRKMLREFLKSDPEPKACVPPARDEDEDEDDVARWRRRRHQGVWQNQANQDEMSDFLRMEDGQSHKELTIDQIMDSADRQHTAVLEKPWYVSEDSNRDRLMASHILDHLDSLLSSIPVRCKEFMLLPEQRLAIIAMTQPLPKESFIKCEITRESMTHITGHRARKVPFSVQFSLEAATLPTWSIADFCTGSGKTIMAIQAALHLLCNRQSWKGLTDNYHSLLRDRLRDTHSGLIKLDHMDNARLAKLAIMFVPGTVLNHWFRTCKSAVHGIKDIYGSQADVLVWKGNSRDYSIQEAYQCGKPVLWVKTMEAESLRDTRETPDIGYAVRIYDELNSKMKTRYDQKESTPLFNYITQATIEALSGATNGAPRHPLRLALGDNFRTMTKVEKYMAESNYKEVQEALTHFCKMRMFAPPEFLRRIVASGVKHNMPAGIIVHHVNFRMGTLAAMETGTEMVEISFADLALRIMGSHVSHMYREKIKDIFTQAEVVSSDEILAKVDQVCEEIEVRSIAENTAKQAILRLKDRLGCMLAGKLPECPITMEPIPRERVRILGCCTCIVDSESLPGCKGRCPLCRAQIKSVGAAREPKEEAEEAKPEEPSEEKPSKEEPSSKAAGKRPASSSVAEADPISDSDSDRVSISDSDSDSDSESEVDIAPKPKRAKVEPVDLAPDSYEDEDMADAAGPSQNGPREEGVPGAVQGGAELAPTDERTLAFRAKLDEISQARHYTVDGVIMILRAQINLNPSSRMLLCFGFDSNQQAEVARLFQRIRGEFPDANVTDIDKCVKNPSNMDSAKQKYDDPVRFPGPQLFIINTTASSSSVQGLDLYATDLTLVASRCSQATQRQAIGRSLRMRKRPNHMKPEERFPAKNVVVTSIIGFA